MISCLFICCVNFTRFTLTYTHSTHSLHLHAMGRNKELTEAQRGAIIYCRKRGDKLCAIAKTVSCGVTTVRDTLKRHAETGHTQSRKRSGRPPLLDSADRQRLKRLVTRKAEYRRLCKAAVQRVWLKKKSPVALSAVPSDQLGCETALHDQSHLFHRRTKQQGSPGVSSMKTGQENGEKFCGVTSQHFPSSNKVDLAEFGITRRMSGHHHARRQL